MEDKEAKKKEEEEPTTRKSLTSSKAGEKEKEKKERVNNKLIYSYYIIDGLLDGDDYEKKGKLHWRHEVATTMNIIEDNEVAAKPTIYQKDLSRGVDKSKLIGAE